MKAAIAAIVLSALAGSVHAQVTVSQIHVGSTEYDTDFIELFNRGNAPVNVSSWALKVTCGTCGVWGNINLTGSIPAHSYYLIALSPASGSRSLPAVQVDAGVPLDPAGGKLILSNDQSPLFAQCPSLDSTVDLVLWGAINCDGYPEAPAMSGALALHRGNGGCTDTNNDGNDFALAAPTPRNTSVTHSCTTGPDCNGNGIDDNIELQDPANDCNGNGQLDACEVAANPALDCNQNGVIDCTDLKTGVLTDVNANGTPDRCEGALIVPASLAVTVLNSGVSPDTDFMRVQGSAVEDAEGRPAPAYAALRWTNASISAALNEAFASGWTIDGVYLHAKKSPDPVSDNGSVVMFHSLNDTLNLTPGSNAARFTTLNSDHAGFASFSNFNYVHVAGQSQNLLLYSPNGPFTNGGGRLLNEIETGAATVTIVMAPGSTFVAAPFAGDTHPTLEAPALVIFATGVIACGNSDFNGDGDFGTDQDIEAFFACLGGVCCATCWPGGSDFNGDGDFGTDQDIESFFRVLAGGEC
jgi:hypothetical protein